MLINQVAGNALRSLIPPPRLQLSNWIEREIVLPEGTSALPGRVKLYPFQRAIADAISDPEIERVTLVKCVRIGFTTLLTSAIGSFVVNEPSPILVLLPTESDARDYCVSDVEPIFAASPALRGVLEDDTIEGERNTLLSRRFPSGSLRIIASRAPRNLRRLTARVLVADEADACEVTAEGNPLLLAERRTLTFSNRKIVVGSTPIFADTSPVLRAYAASDQRIYEVPCPECGVFQEISWQHIEWEPDRPETAAYRCPNCKSLIPERHKAMLVEAGHWRATRPEIQGHAGFRINALVSLLANASWAKLAAEFLAVKSDPPELQTFVNTILAQGWSTPSLIDETSLATRSEAFDLNNIPPEVLTITMGCDVQDDRLESSLLGWTKSNECLVLAHIIIWGNYTDGETWRELDKLLRTRWQHPFGGTLAVDAAIVDAGDGEHFETVMGFCIPRTRRHVFAGKGMAGRYPSFQMAKGQTIASKQALIGVDTIKNWVFNRLQHGRGTRFSHTLPQSYYEQLASEHLVVRYVRGMPKRRFERIGDRRAEALDCLVYGIAARASYQVTFDQREAELRAATPLLRQAPGPPLEPIGNDLEDVDPTVRPYRPPPPPVDQPSFIFPNGRSSWWDRG
jgi:phage terminase large subunit GpA-like protein